MSTSGYLPDYLFSLVGECKKANDMKAAERLFHDPGWRKRFRGTMSFESDWETVKDMTLIKSILLFRQSFHSLEVSGNLKDYHYLVALEDYHTNERFFLRSARTACFVVPQSKLYGLLLFGLAAAEGVWDEAEAKVMVRSVKHETTRALSKSMRENWMIDLDESIVSFIVAEDAPPPKVRAGARRRFKDLSRRFSRRTCGGGRQGRASVWCGRA